MIPVAASGFQAANYAVGGGPTSVAAGDFNGDGKQDLAVASIHGNSVSILLGNGDGTFRVAGGFAVGISPYSVVVGDFNGDGRTDLAVSTHSSVTVLLGNGNGTFQPAVNNFYNAGSLGNSVVVGDFNADGKADLAVTNENGSLVDPLFGVSTVCVFLGNGDGTFQPAVHYPAGVLRGVQNDTGIVVTAGDFNADGRTDLAIADYKDVTVLFGNGDGTFQPAVSAAPLIGGFINPFGSAIKPVGVVAGDFNGDGKLDLAAVSSNGIVSVLLGNGDGTFQSVVTYAAGGASDLSLSIAAYDLNGDGKADLVVSLAGASKVSVLFGTGSGTFQAPVNYVTGGGPQLAAIGDFNGDGRADLAVPNANDNNVTVLIGKAPGFAITSVSLAGGTEGNPYSAALSASGGITPYGNWAVSAGRLPPGLTLSASTGVISGTPTTANGSPFSFSVSVRDSAGTSSQAQPLAISIANKPARPDLTIAKSHDGNFMQGQSGAAYRILVSNLGPDPSSDLVTVTDTLPVGLTATGIAGDGWTCVLSTLACTRSNALPAGAAYPAITVTVIVAADAPASVLNTATVSGGGDSNLSNNSGVDPTNVIAGPSILTTALDAGLTDSPYSFTLLASGGSPPYAWSIASGSLPDGLALASDTGVISGTPTTLGDSTFLISVTDAAGATATQPFTLTIAPSSALKPVGLRKRR